MDQKIHFLRASFKEGKDCPQIWAIFLICLYLNDHNVFTSFQCWILFSIPLSCLSSNNRLHF